MTGTECSLPVLLRAVADLLEANPDLPPPQVNYDGRVQWFTAHTPADVAAIMRAIPGRWVKNDPAAGSFDEGTATFTTEFHSAKARISIERGRVCTRVVTGRREVTKTVPVTVEEVTVVEDVVEWQCHSVLAAAAETPAELAAIA